MRLGAGCVLTGGGSMLPGMLDVTESQLRVPARIGYARAAIADARRADSSLLTPWRSECCLYAHRTRTTRAAEDNSLRAKLRAMFAASF